MKRGVEWFKQLSMGGKVAAGLAAFFVFGMVVGAVAPPEEAPNQDNETEEVSVAEEFVADANFEPELKTETETESIAFKTIEQEDNTRELGTQAVSQAGVNGVETITYEVTYLDGEEVSRREINREITKQPVNKIVLVGTYSPPPQPVATSSNCDPNYSGCVPIDSDVDCAGGSGNGPSYATGPVTVIGTDIYGLDGDGDGIGCE